MLVLQVITLAVGITAQYTDRTPHVDPNASPTPLTGCAASWECDVPRFLGIPGLVWGIVGVAVVIFIFGQFIVGWRNPFAKKKPNPYVVVTDDARKDR